MSRTVVLILLSGIKTLLELNSSQIRESTLRYRPQVLLEMLISVEILDLRIRISPLSSWILSFHNFIGRSEVDEYLSTR